MVKFYEGVGEELIPYVRALAWWHAIPKPPPSKHANQTVKLNRRSRLMARLDNGGVPDLPEIAPELEYLVGCLFDAGPMSAGGGATPVPLTWADLWAWQDGSGIVLLPWQARLLRRLSAEYLSESLTADAHDAPPPWARVADREMIARHVKRILRG